MLIDDFFNCAGDFDQQGDDHLIVDEDVLEERQALAPLDQLVQPWDKYKNMDIYKKTWTNLKQLGQI